MLDDGFVSTNISQRCC